MTKLSQKGSENLKRSTVRKNYEEPPEQRRGSDGPDQMDVCPSETLDCGSTRRRTLRQGLGQEGSALRNYSMITRMRLL